MSLAISVIMPVYNAEKYLTQSLNCVVNQTLRNIEIICVDDGSTDGSLGILKAFAEKDNRIKILNQENKNAGAARNTGLDVAKGEYLSFLDADDLFELNMLENAYKEAVAHSAEIVMFDADVFDSDTEERLPSAWILNKSAIPAKEVFESGDMSHHIFTSFFNVAWNRICNREYILNLSLRFQEIEKHNDSYFSVMSLICAKRIRYVDSVFVHYRRGDSKQISSSYLGKKDFYPALYAMQEIHENIKTMENYNILIKGFSKYSTSLLLLPFLSIRQEDYFRIFALLKETWLPRLPTEVFHDEDYFYKYDEYRQIKSIYENDAMGHLFTLLEMQNEKVGILEKNKRWYFHDKRVKKGSSVVLYGAGEVGSDYCRVLSDSKSINLVAWLDNNYVKYRQEGLAVDPPQTIANLEYDWVVVAVLHERVLKAIREALWSYGVPDCKIIWPFKTNIMEQL